MEDSVKNWSTSQITVFFLGSAFLVGSGVLLAIVLIRRSCSSGSDDRTITKHLKLPISSSDNTYTVAYQLKSTGSKQPDIISRGKFNFVIVIFISVMKGQRKRERETNNLNSSKKRKLFDKDEIRLD